MMTLLVESTKTTSMEDVSTGVLEKKNNEYLRSKYKAKMSKYKKNENIQPSMSKLQSIWCLKIDFQKVDRHAGGKWLIHDTKRRKDNQLQSLKLPCRISKLSSNSCPNVRSNCTALN